MKFKLKFHFFFFIFLVSIFFAFLFWFFFPAFLLTCRVDLLYFLLFFYQFTSCLTDEWPTSHFLYFLLCLFFWTLPLFPHPNLLPSLPLSPSVCLPVLCLPGLSFHLLQSEEEEEEEVRLKLASVPKSVGTPGGQIGGVVVFWWHTHTSHTHLSILTSKRHDYRTVKG